MIAKDREIFDELCLACRAGDLESVDKIVSSGINVNQVDEWDYSPLILSSLCGHESIVRLLLSRGAVCDRDTFEGARCIYGALTDSIRNILLAYDISKAVDSTQPFAAHISSILSQRKIITADIIVTFPENKHIRLNRFLLHARCPYFREKLSRSGEWFDKEVVELADINIEVFKLIIDYVYLVADIKFDSVDVDELVDYANKSGLTDLVESIRIYCSATTFAEKSKSKHEISYIMVEKARTDLQNFLNDMVFERKEIVTMTDSDFEKNNMDDFIDTTEYLKDADKLALLNLESSPDIIISVIDERKIVYYPCHKSILIRSEYFETMFTSSFHEATTSKLTNFGTVSRDFQYDQIPIIQIDVASSTIAEIMLGYLYFDEAEVPAEYAIDVLFSADRLFIERLKTMAAVAITNSDLDEYDSIFTILRAGWETRVDRLESFVAKKIAYNLNYYIDKEEFAEIILESANRIELRQETDTIELIDDIRFYLRKKYVPVYQALLISHTNLQRYAIDDGGSLAPELIGEYVNLLSADNRKYEKDIDKINDLLSSLGLDA